MTKQTTESPVQLADKAHEAYQSGNYESAAKLYENAARVTRGRGRREDYLDRANHCEKLAAEKAAQVNA